MNAFRTLLLHLDASPGASARLAFARHLAQHLEATLCGMHVAQPPQQPIQMAFVESPAALLQRIDAAAAERARALFETAHGEGGPTLRWLDDAGDGLRVFCRQALYADLLVLGQHDPASPSSGCAPEDFVETALISTGKPALVLPFAGEFDQIGRDVLIGWNATIEAAHAVQAALPWLRTARRVHVLADAAEATSAATTSLDIAQFLQSHGCVPAMHRMTPAPAEAGDALLSLANDVGADLLVMGCYGHSRSREWVLGGASRTVLRTMTLPVLMAH